MKNDLITVILFSSLFSTSEMAINTVIKMNITQVSFFKLCWNANSQYNNGMNNGNSMGQDDNRYKSIAARL